MRAGRIDEIMMSIDSAVSLREVTAENWYDCCQLSVKEEQDRFVEPNAVSIAQSKYEPTLRLRAVYLRQDLVGFSMYNTEPEELGGHWIYRLMIDKRYQRKGIAKDVMRLIIDEMATSLDCKRIVAGYKPDNTAAGALYTSLGFEDRGNKFGKEMAVVLDLQ